MRVWRWALSFWIFFIFLLSPLARGAQELVRNVLGKSGIALLLCSLCGISLLAALRFFKHGELSRSRSLLLVLALLPLFCLLYSLSGNPEEVFHVLEYGGLSFLFLQTEPQRGCWSGYIAACLTSSVGVLEELFQWVLPNRIFDFRDIGINLIAAFLVQILLWGLCPSRLSLPRSSDLARILSATLLLGSLLLVCLLPSPQHLSEMARVFPVLAQFGEEARAGSGEGPLDLDLIYGVSREAILGTISAFCFILILARLAMLKEFCHRALRNSKS